MTTNLYKQLQTFRSLKAPKSLRNKIHGTVDTLPSRHTGFYLPLFTFQAAGILAVLLLVVGLTSGIVAGAQKSSPGEALYPVKELLNKIPTEKSSVSVHIIPSAIPTGEGIAKSSTSSATAHGSASKQPNNKKENDQEKEGYQENPVSHVEKFFEKVLHHDNLSKGNSYSHAHNKK